MILLLVAQAHASAYYFLDSGTRSIGRGGAFIVGADDTSAQYYNPAALANVKRTMVNVNVWGVNQYIHFDRADDDAGEYEPIENESPPIIEPQGGVIIPLRGVAPFLKWTTLAVGLYVPTSPYLKYPTDGAQRYALDDSLIWQIYAGPSIAQRMPFADWITVGAGLQYTFLRVDESITATSCTTFEQDEDGSCPGDDEANDILLQIKSWDTMKWSANFGVMVEPTPWLKFGGAAQPPIHYEPTGSMTASFNDENALVSSQLEPNKDGKYSYTDKDIRVLVDVPWIVRAGVEVRPVDKVAIELDGTWTQWSALSKLSITDVNLTLAKKEGGQLTEDLVVNDDVNFATGYKDAWSGRLGGDYTPLDWLKVRAGIHYETSAIPDTTQGVQLVDGTKYGFGVGGTFTIAKRVAFDVAFAQQFLGNRTISDSDLRQQALIYDLDLVDPENTKTSVGQGRVVGNGDFVSQLTFVGVGATVYLGADDTSAAKQ